MSGDDASERVSVYVCVTPPAWKARRDKYYQESKKRQGNNVVSPLLLCLDQQALKTGMETGRRVKKNVAWREIQ